MILDILEHVHGPAWVDEVNGQTGLAKTSCAADAMQVRLAIGVSLQVDGQVVVDDDRHLFDVDTARQHVGGDENLRLSLTESVQNVDALLDLQLAAEQSHLMAVLGHLLGQPRRCRSSLLFHEFKIRQNSK